MRSRKFTDLEIESPGKVLIRHHEGAIVCSLEQVISGEEEDLKYLVSGVISDIARWTEEQGGLVGHIKAVLQTKCGSWMYSCTGDEIHVRELPEPGGLLLFTAIVFFVDEEQLKRRLDVFLERLR